jgi:hypothetical protein
MKTIVAFFSISLFSLLTGFVEFRQNLECSHCQYITKFESLKYVNPDQPKPYLHDKDSTLMIYPIVENADNPGYRYIRDIKFVYKDLHYCSDVSKITIVNRSGKFSVNTMPRMSCVIKSIARFDDNQVLQLKKIPTQKVIIENLVTDNIYEYELKDSLYFIKVYKIEDYVERPIQGNQPKFTPKKSGWVK